MATMNVSLPDQMKDWVEDQTRSGQYSNSSDYVRDLIRRDQERRAKIAHIQKLVDEGLASGISTRSKMKFRGGARPRRKLVRPESDGISPVAGSRGRYHIHCGHRHRRVWP